MLADRALAFLRRDFAVETSYRAAFFMQFGSMFIGVASFYFMSRLLGSAASPYLAEYGGDYFGFALIGIAFVGLQSLGLTAFSSAIGRAQSDGTLEAMLTTPTSVRTIILSSSIWGFLMTALSITLYLVYGAVFFGADLGGANIPAALLVLALSTIAFGGLGILSASVIMVIKRGDPVSWVFSSVSSFLGGVVFPVALLPGWLERIAHVLPVFYALRAMRMTVLQGAGIAELGTDLIILACFAAVSLPLGMLAFSRALGVAKTEGTLGTY